MRRAEHTTIEADAARGAASRPRVVFLAPMYTGIIPWIFEGRDWENMPGFCHLLERLVERRWAVDVGLVTQDPTFAIPTRNPFEVHGMRVHVLQGHARGPGWEGGASGAAGKLAALAVEALGSFQWLLAMARETNPCVFYAHGRMSLVVSAAASVAGVPNVTRLFGTSLLAAMRAGTYQPSHVSEVLQFVAPADAVIVTDDGTGGLKVGRALGIAGDRLHVWRNGVRVRAEVTEADRCEARRMLGVDDGTAVVMTTNRLEGWKRTHLAVEAMKVPRARGLSARYFVVGDGVERGRLESLAREVGVHDSVEFVGSVDHPTLETMLAGCDVFLSMYERSNIGNALLEAMASGCAVVVADTGDTSSLVEHGVSGLVVSADPTPDEVGEAICRHLEDEEDRREMGAAARRCVVERTVTWTQRMDREIDLLERLVSRGPGERLGIRRRSGSLLAALDLLLAKQSVRGEDTGEGAAWTATGGDEDTRGS